MYVATLTGIEYIVLADKGRFIQVQDEHGVAGWFDKKHAVRLEDAVDFFTDRIRAEPKNASTFCKRAIAWQLKGKFDNAVKDFDEAIRLDPKDADAFNNRGLVWLDKQEYDKAIKDFDEVIRLDPKHPLAFINRGVVWVERQEYDKAIKDYDEAIHLDPKYVLAINNKAWLLATASDAKYRDGKRAVELATRACELSGWKVANYVDTLAAACAAAGQFAEAVQWQEKALEDTNFIKANGKKANEKLELFRDKKPYHKQ